MGTATNSYNNWIGGELSTEMYGRYELPVYDKGAEIIRNFLVRVQGPLSFRPGFEFITNTKGNKKAILRHFIFNDDLAYALEFTDQKLRFYKNGALIMDGDNAYELTTPFEESKDLDLIQVASSADIMHIVHPKYQPQKLTRTSDANWTIAAITGTSFPFTSSGNYPRAVTFAQGRCWYGGTENAIDKIWASRGPDSSNGNSRFDDFTTGTDDTNAMTFILTPPSGKVEAIEWIKSNNKFLLVGTYSGVSKMTGGSDETAITPSAINVRQITDAGACSTVAESMGSSVYYVQRNRLKMREIRYYLADDAYIAEDRNKVSTEIMGPGFKEIAYTQGEPDIVWAACTDGILIGMTADKAEGVAGWHRHYLGGSGAVESITSIPRKGNPDQLYAVIRRKINGQTVRYVEFLTDEVKMPVEVDFYSDDEDFDKEHWYNALYQAQLGYRFLDSCVSYYGDVYATQALELSVNVSTHVWSLTSTADIFESSWVGRQIWGKYDSLGYGGGRYKITEYVNAREVHVEILASSDSSTLKEGEWYLTTDHLENLDHLEGETVGVFASGQSHPDRTVDDGEIELDAQYSVIHVGLKYVGIFKTMDLELGGGRTGSKSTLGAMKRIQRIDVKLKDTLGPRFGTNLYDTTPIYFADTEQRLGMPPRPFSGIKEVPMMGGWNNGGVDDVETHLVVMQKEPQPCNIQIINTVLEVTDE